MKNIGIGLVVFLVFFNSAHAIETTTSWRAVNYTNESGGVVQYQNDDVVFELSDEGFTIKTKVKIDASQVCVNNLGFLRTEKYSRVTSAGFYQEQSHLAYIAGDKTCFSSSDNVEISKTKFGILALPSSFLNLFISLDQDSGTIEQGSGKYSVQKI